MKHVLALAAVLAVAGSAMARGPDYRPASNGKGGPIALRETRAPIPTGVLASAQEKPAAATQPADAKKYVCPMGCAGSESDQPGNCPKCGMKLVEEKAKSPKHIHQH